MSRRATPPIRSSIAAVIALLITAGTALAATSKLSLAGPSGVTLRHNQKYTVTVSGTASTAGSKLFVYEGGQVRGGTAAITCYSTESSEFARYRPAPRVHVFLGAKPEYRSFSVTYRFLARNPGPRSFCAYLASGPYGTTYAHAELHWTNSSS